MIVESDASAVEFGLIPGVDEINAKAAAADLLDLQRHLRQHDGVIKIGFDGSDDFDAFRQRRCRCRSRPCLELLVARTAGADGMLRDQRAVEAELFGEKNYVLVVLPRCVRSLFRMLQRAETTGNRRPHAEAGINLTHRSSSSFATSPPDTPVTATRSGSLPLAVQKAEAPVDNVFRNGHRAVKRKSDDPETEDSRHADIGLLLG
jgi:hypothetical protein